MCSCFSCGRAAGLKTGGSFLKVFLTANDTPLHVSFFFLFFAIMKKRLGFCALLLIVKLSSVAQSFPKNYFISPLDTPLILTGNFGEIRNDHFHSGIDISTDEQEGLPVMCVGDGYISRIKISSDGYGKALYVTHPNGYVSVYGHLEKFMGPVNEYVRKIQLERQNFEIDVNLKDKQFKVKQRDFIAYTGKTGSAEGPHLHFEIRDEKTEEPINPLHFLSPVKDTIAPVIKYIRIYPLRENGSVNKTDSAVTYDVIEDSLGYRLNMLEYPLAFGNIAFGIGAIDYINNSESQLGIYSAELYIDETPTFTWRYDRLNFDDTRMVNAHIDYKLYERDRIVVERAHRLPGNTLEMSGDTSVNGFVFFADDAAHEIRMVVRDFKGNMSQINFQVITYTSMNENPYQPKAIDAVEVTNEKGVAIHKSKFDVVIPDGAVYEDYFYDDAIEPSTKYLSDIYRIGDEYEPLNVPVTIGIKPDVTVADSLKSKLVIARIRNDGSLQSLGGQWSGKFLSAKSREFGRFTVSIDTTPPVLEKFYTPADMNTMFGSQLQIRAIDSFSGLKNYSAQIDGKWHLFEYDKKTDMLIANIESMAVNLNHHLEMTVTDERGNTTVWTLDFYF